MKKILILLLIVPFFFACKDDASSSSESESKPDPKPIVQGSCGDGKVDVDNGEECDGDAFLGNLPNYYGCTKDCKIKGYCGDGKVDVDDGEVCDGDYGCKPNCTGYVVQNQQKLVLILSFAKMVQSAFLENVKDKKKQLMKPVLQMRNAYLEIAVKVSALPTNKHSFQTE